MPTPKQLLPEPVHRHSRGQRVLGRHEPLGQVHARSRSVRFLHRGQEARRITLDALAGLVVVAANQNVGGPYVGSLFHHHGHRNRDFQRPLLGLDFFQCFSRLLQLRVQISGASATASPSRSRDLQRPQFLAPSSSLPAASSSTSLPFSSSSLALSFSSSSRVRRAWLICPSSSASCACCASVARLM